MGALYFSSAVTTVSSLTEFLLCKTPWIKIINEMIGIGGREFLRDSAAFSAQEQLSIVRVDWQWV